MSFILLSFSGVVLVITNGDVFAVLNSPISLAANLLLIAGALCWVLYTIGGSYFPGWSPLRYTTMTTLLGMISVVLIDLFLVGSGAISVPSAASIITIVPHLFYMALVAGLVAVLCWNVGNRIIYSNKWCALYGCCSHYRFYCFSSKWRCANKHANYRGRNHSYGSCTQQPEPT